uniref:Uncharacterized protein n=1 Tax=Steinernema glaseri TaxID=37863 RepID=A0A1I8ACA9_9BILA
MFLNRQSEPNATLQIPINKMGTLKKMIKKIKVASNTRLRLCIKACIREWNPKLEARRRHSHTESVKIKSYGWDIPHQKDSSRVGIRRTELPADGLLSSKQFGQVQESRLAHMAKCGCNSSSVTCAMNVHCFA